MMPKPPPEDDHSPGSGLREDEAAAPAADERTEPGGALAAAAEPAVAEPAGDTATGRPDGVPAAAEPAVAEPASDTAAAVAAPAGASSVGARADAAATAATGPGADLPKRLVIYAILVAAARFVPIPLVDDLLPEKLRQLLVRSVLREAGRTYSSSRVEALYEDQEGCLMGCVGFIILLPIKLLLFPIRKVLAVFRAVREGSQLVLSTLLLGRTIGRCLERGLLAEGASEPVLKAEAQGIRKAFEQALQRTNPALVSSPLEALLGSVKGMLRAVAELARRLVRGGTGSEVAQPAELPLEQLPERERKLLDRTVKAVQDLFKRPDMAAFMAQFDARFDAELAVLGASGELPPAPDRGQAS